MNRTQTEEWREAFRLLHKFCPESRQFTGESFRPNAYNDGWQLIDAVDPEPIEWRPVPDLESAELLQFVLGETLAWEEGRAVFFPDSPDALPVVCSSRRLLERVAEEYPHMVGCTDVLLFFETTGRILFFDHEDGCGLATPRRWKYRYQNQNKITDQQADHQ